MSIPILIFGYSSDTSKKYIGSEYSTEKPQYFKYENSISSHRGSKHNSTNESVKNRKDEYVSYMDRPFNSIDGKRVFT